MPEKLTTIQVHVPVQLVARLETVLAKAREREGKRVTKRHIITGLLMEYVSDEEAKGERHGK